MPKVYVNLVKNIKKKFYEVPPEFQYELKKMLINQGHAELVEE